jgi:glyoxylase-like metal-dependent hydrolase (beta-lactamase superfamily II)
MQVSGRATFTSFETAGGVKIHRVPLEAFPNFWAYVYIVQKDAYCILIDTGSGTILTNCYPVSTGGNPIFRLDYILLTHAIDHFGGPRNSADYKAGSMP